MDELIPLDCLKTGQLAEVSRLVGPVDHVHRLEEFGLYDGVRIEMFRPGNPCILRMAGSKFCMRIDGRLKVLVRRHNGTSG
jgi:Fe2+ transport system protein FeoA